MYPMQSGSWIPLDKIGPFNPHVNIKFRTCIKINYGKFVYPSWFRKPGGGIVLTY